MTGQLHTERPRFPALDPEPPPGARRRRRLLALAVAGVAAAALAAGLLLGTTGSAGGHQGRSGAPLGVTRSARIVLITPLGELATAGIDGTHLAVLGSLGRYGNGFPTASPDGQYLAAPDGSIFSLRDGTVVPVKATLHLSQKQVLSMRGPFADHDRAMLVLTEGMFGNPTANAGVDAAPLAGGQPVPLGDADEAVGDPQQLGAFVSVLGQEVGASPGGQVAPPDSSVELRDAGVPAVTLITAAQAAAAVGLDPGVAVVLYPAPDPQGDKVAVGVAPASGGLTEGLVVLDRSGRTVAQVPVGLGPIAGSLVSWSPDGSALAFIGSGADGREIATWRLASAVAVRTVPGGGTFAARCIWSADGSAVICPAGIGGRAKPQWYIATSTPGPVAVVDAPGYAIASMPGSPGPGAGA